MRNIFRTGLALMLVCCQLASAATTSGPGSPPAPASCGCPPMPAAATSDKPTKGHVHGELHMGDLEAMMSNRHIMFANDWDDALLALGHELDPTGKNKLSDAPAPPIIRHTGLVEGGTSYFLFHPDAPKAPGQESNPFGYIKQGDSLIGMLITTLARINKYGEPEKGLRDATLAIARFLAGKLILFDPDDATKRFARDGIGMLAKTQLSSNLSLAHQPTFEIKIDDRDSSELPLSNLDYAYAALDVLFSVDSRGQKSDLSNYFRELDGRADDVRYLVEMASKGSQFGGAANPGSTEDALACHAFTTLLHFADIETPESPQVRREVLALFWEPLFDPGANQSRIAVIRGTLLAAGIATIAEAESLTETLFNYASGREAGRMEVLITVNGLIAHAGGNTRATYREKIAERLSEILDQLEKRQKAGTGGFAERQWLDEWKKGAPTPPLPPMTSLCQPDPGKNTTRIFLYAITPDGLQSVKHLYVGVPTVFEAQYDPPSGEAEVKLDVTAGGDKQQFTLKRFDQRGYLYRSDPVILQAPQLKKSEVFNPKVKGVAK